VEKAGKILAGDILGRMAPKGGNAAPQLRPAQTQYPNRPTVNRSADVANDEDRTGRVRGADGESGGRQESSNDFFPTARRKRIGIRSDLTKVKGILSKVLSHRGLDKRVERYEFILHWPEIVGERLAEVSRPEYIRNRALIVNVIHPVWAQELAMIKPVLLESLAKYLKPGDIVQDMVFRIHAP
jgi:predicted nucleic acid-binding Zn ribbon protein